MASIYHCIFCNTPVEGNAKILNCLHVICNKCDKQRFIRRSRFGIRCKCKSITKGELQNYSITSPNLTIRCNDKCRSLATKFCLVCNSFHCKPCSKVHLSINKDHNQNAIVSYPLREPIAICSNCKKSRVVMCCTKCDVILCSLCHLTYHSTHTFKMIHNLRNEILLNIANKNNDMEKNIKFIKQRISIAESQAIILETQKDEIDKNIDNIYKLLYEEINNRKMELKRVVDLYITDIHFQLKEDMVECKQLRGKNRYLFDISESFINQNIINFNSLLALKMATDRLKCNNKSTLNFKHIMNLNILSPKDMNLQFIYAESMKNSLSCINSLRKIILPKVLDLKDIIKQLNRSSCYRYIVNTNLNSCILNNDLIPILTNKDNSRNFLPITCACCNQWSEEMNQCNFCKRFYHNNCHIPLLNTNIYGALQTRLKCTMCVEIIFESDRNQISIIEDLSIDKIEWKLIERILMELYCQNSYSEFFRNCPNKLIYFDYYLMVSNPISLNDIKNRHESDLPYESIIEFIMDVKCIFSNAKLYFHQNNPLYQSAINLEEFFNLKLISWIPELQNSLVIDYNNL